MYLFNIKIIFWIIISFMALEIAPLNSVFAEDDTIGDRLLVSKINRFREDYFFKPKFIAHDKWKRVYQGFTEEF